MKQILVLAVAAISLSLGGCLFNPFYGPPIYAGSQYQNRIAPPTPVDIQAQSQGKAFVKLVAFLRANAATAQPTPELKAQLAVHLKNAGLTYKCFDKEGCYFLRGTTRIRVDNKYIFVYGGDNKSFMKIERTDVAVNIIY